MAWGNISRGEMALYLYVSGGEDGLRRKQTIQIEENHLFWFRYQPPTRLRARCLFVFNDRATRWTRSHVIGWWRRVGKWPWRLVDFLPRCSSASWGGFTNREKLCYDFQHWIIYLQVFKSFRALDSQVFSRQRTHLSYCYRCT